MVTASEICLGTNSDEGEHREIPSTVCGIVCHYRHTHCTVTDDANHSLPPKMPCENRKTSSLNLNGSACALALFFSFSPSQRLELGQTCLSADVGRLWEHVFIPKALILCEELYWWAYSNRRERRNAKTCKNSNVPEHCCSSTMMHECLKYI